MLVRRQMDPADYLSRSDSQNINCCLFIAIWPLLPYTHQMNKPAILHTAKCLLIAATLGVAVGYLAHVGEAPGGPQKAGWMTFVLAMVLQSLPTGKTDKRKMSLPTTTAISSLISQ